MRLPDWGIQEAACDKLILAHFPWSHWEIDTKEHRPITEKGILRRISVSKISEQFQRSLNKKFIIVQGSEKLFKNLENHYRICKKFWLKCLYLQKKYLSSDTVPIIFHSSRKQTMYHIWHKVYDKAQNGFVKKHTAAL